MGTAITLPQGMAYGWWHFPEPFLDDVTFEVEFVSGDERQPGRYYQLYQGKIGDVGIYLGFQTDICRPGIGGLGKGLLFSRWETRNNDDARPVAGGWIENSGHEDNFVGVRSLFDWTLGPHRCWLHCVEENEDARWYEFRVVRLADNREATAGSLRFPKREGRGALIHSGGGSWTEVYSGVRCAEDVPFTHVALRSIAANDGSMRPTRCDTTYNTKFPCADCFVSSDGALHLTSGRGVSQEHPSRSYAIGI